MKHMLTCYAVVIPGLEPIAAAELAALNVHDIEADEGGVHFQTSPDGLMRVNLRARTLTRILLRLKQFKALSFPELFNKSAGIAWQDFIRADGELHVQARSHHSKLIHSGRIEQTVRAAIVQRLKRYPPAATASSTLGVHVRFDHDVCQLSLDTSGERLDRRGYRVAAGPAPMRETMAAALLQWMGWQADQVLMVPMCGSGTLAIEAALSVAHIAPGLQHCFPLVGWPGFSERRWRRVYDKAQAMRRDVDVRIALSDIQPEYAAQARRNIAAAGIADMLQPEVHDFFALRPVTEHGLIMLNPPYGRRIGHAPGDVYRRIGEHLKRHFATWRCMVLAPDQASRQQLGLSVRRHLKIRHGGKWIVALDVSPGKG